MVNATKIDKKLLANELKKDLVYFSRNKKKPMSESEANNIANRLMENLDIDNPVFAHKGTSWLAKEILKNRD